MKTTIKAELVAHSKNQQGDELISILATFPRIILAEVNTHRMLSKNTSSSRAIPFSKMVESVQNDPFIPIAWQKEHKGMQGSEYFLDIKDTDRLEMAWELARDEAVIRAKALSEFSVTKQLCNRLLEPFMWTTMLITGSREGWDNFFKLRCPQYEFGVGEKPVFFKSKKEYQQNIISQGFDYIIPEEEWKYLNKGQAEIHIMDLAEKIYDAVNESTPKLLKPGEWHIPFEDKIKENFALIPVQFTLPDSVRISVAMAARTSYTVVGEEKAIDYEAMIGLHDRLLAQNPPHSSPLEHCCRAMTEDEYYIFSKGARKYDVDGDEVTDFSILGWCNNIKGFIPYRYMVDNATEK